MSRMAESTGAPEAGTKSRTARERVRTELSNVIKDVARQHLADIESKIARLLALRTEVQSMVEQCARGEIKDCRVIEVLADHGACQHRHH